MSIVRGYATHGPSARLEPFRFERRETRPDDLRIAILYCGVCHSDIHAARGDWGPARYPMVPGHEIVGRVIDTGGAVSGIEIGEIVGVGCFVDSCRTCRSCREGVEQHCEGLLSITYNSTEQDGETPTFGGYSSEIVVDHRYVLRIPATLDPARTAPLLCAGVTTYSPLRRFRAGPSKRVGVVGLGGLGHMAVKFSSAMGAEVTVFSSSPSKARDAKDLGATEFVHTRDPKTLNRFRNKLDLVLDTVSAEHDLNVFLQLLGRDGTLVLLGGPADPLEVNAFSLLRNRRQLAGSLIGGIRETQEMLAFSGANNIEANVEVIPIQDVNEAYERTIRGDVRYRFVIDLETLNN